MNTLVRKEIEELMIGGRRKTVEEFDLMIDKYLQKKAEKEKDEIGEALQIFIPTGYINMFRLKMNLPCSYKNHQSRRKHYVNSHGTPPPATGQAELRSIE